MHYLELGGAETALIGLLRAWDYSVADVDLFLHSHRGEMMRYLPAEVRLLPEIKDYSLIECPIKDTLRNLRLGIAYGRWKARREHHRFIEHNPQPTGDAEFGYIGRYVTPHLPPVSDTVYDLAISFLAPHDIVLRKVKAKKKICWIHTDYTSIGHNAALEAPVWDGYDRIVSISPAVTAAFLERHPSLGQKIIEINNILSPEIVKGRAGESTPAEFHPDIFNILSVGRFSMTKNFHKIPMILKKVINLTGRTDLKWFIIGYGGEETRIRRSIADEGMEGNVILLGKRENPYPYIAGCDLYVQPSLYEGRSVTVREAQMLGRPVVITAYPTSGSQLENGADGIIVPLDTDGCAAGLAGIIGDESLRDKLSTTCLNRDYSDSSEVGRLLQEIPNEEANNKLI